jgi:hypothetical protein
MATRDPTDDDSGRKAPAPVPTAFTLLSTVLWVVVPLLMCGLFALFSQLTGAK